MPSPGKARLEIVLPVLGGLVLAGHVVAIQPWKLDDAFIFFRYAENWVNGAGLVYNAGERVEGYTSFLWVALLAGLHALGVDTVAASVLLGGLFALGSIALLAASPRLLPEIDPATARCAAFLLGTFGVFTPWATSGMETSLAAFLTTLAILFTLRLVGNEPASPRPARLATLGILQALVVLARPEGGLVFVFALGLLGRRKARLVEMLALAAGFMLVLVPFEIWRFAYYGDWLPNTFYAKVGATSNQLWRGVRYTARFVVAALPQLLALVAGRVLRRSRTQAGRLGWLPVFLLLHALYVVAVGGDIMPAFRFFAPIAPLLALTAAVSMRALGAGRRAAAAVVGCAAWGVAGMWVLDDIHDRIRDDHVAELGAVVGLWMRDALRPDAVLATNTAGSIPYYSKLRTLDMLGLTDRHIAHSQPRDMGGGFAGHEKHDGDYVLGRRPDWIQFGSSLGSPVPLFPGDREVHDQPGFASLYEPETYRLTGPMGSFDLYLFRRRNVRPPP